MRRSCGRDVPAVCAQFRRQQVGVGGYTLLELVLTLSIVAALLVLALPGFGHLLAERRATYAAHEVQRVLRAAQQTATAHAGRFRRVEARFADHPEGVRVELWGVPWDEQPAELLGWSRVGPPSVTVRRSGASTFTVAFAASGSVLPGSQGTVEVRSGDAARYVVVAAVTGRVRVAEVPP